MNLGAVVIGRNEGDRLVRCLESLRSQVASVVYVDSGSTDGSVGRARELVGHVVELDTSLPFSAARARNAGFEHLMTVEGESQLEAVQFVDGDCEVVAGWLEAATQALAGDKKLAVVCGRRRERHPEHSVYNRLMDLEWDTPVGAAEACGGDSMVRVSAFREVEGFDPSVVAGEEPEMCHRLRGKGWKIARLDHEMTVHDAAMLRFGQWWRRQVRTGYGCLDAWSRCGVSMFADPIRSARLWGIGWPVVAGVACGLGAWLGSWSGGSPNMPGGWRVGAVLGIALAMLLLAAQTARIAIAGWRAGLATQDAIAHGVLTILSKWAQLIGHWRWLSDQRVGRVARQIEYKRG